jgi:predicted acetyltransferase
MDISIRTVGPDEFEQWVRAIALSFSFVPAQTEIDAWRHGFEPARSLVAVDGDRMVGTAASFLTELTVPGGFLPMGGVTSVGVTPTHRRRGILTGLMRRQLDDAHEAGEPLATLWASESSIYGRFGYGMAARNVRYEIERDRATLREPVDPVGRVVLMERDKARPIIEDVYERVRTGVPGMYAMPEARWEEVMADLEFERGGASALFFVVHETDGSPDGFVTYRVKSGWGTGFPESELRVTDLVAQSDAAYRELWTYCLGVDLMKNVVIWAGRIDEPLLYMLAEPRRLRGRMHDSLWVRLVDVPAALAGRRYSARGSLAIGVRDAFCPWNEGTYELTAGPDGVECHSSSRDPELTIEASALGAAYLSDVGFRTLRTAGRAQGDDDVVERADRLFSWPVRPWCPMIF